MQMNMAEVLEPPVQAGTMAHQAIDEARDRAAVLGTDVAAAAYIVGNHPFGGAVRGFCRLENLDGGGYARSRFHKIKIVRRSPASNKRRNTSTD